LGVGYGCEALSVAGLQPADGKEAPYRLGASAPSWVLSGLRPWGFYWIVNKKINCKHITVSSSSRRKWQVKNGIPFFKFQLLKLISPHRST